MNFTREESIAGLRGSAEDEPQLSPERLAHEPETFPTFTTTEAALDEHFSAYGETVETAIIRDKSGASRGFGFVTFRDEAALDAALAAGDEHMINGFPVEVKRSTHGESTSSTSKKVFVGGVGGVGKDALREYFSEFGTVSDAQVMYDYTSGKSRGFGFVTFDDEDAAKACLEKKVHVLAGQAVDVKAAQPRASGRHSGDVSNDSSSAGSSGYPRRSGNRSGWGRNRRQWGGADLFRENSNGSYFAYPQAYVTAEYAPYTMVTPGQYQMMYSSLAGMGMGYGNQLTYAYGSPAYATASVGDQAAGVGAGMEMGMGMGMGAGMGMAMGAGMGMDRMGGAGDGRLPASSLGGGGRHAYRHGHDQGRPNGVSPGATDDPGR